MIRFCPNCETEREVHENFCQGLIDGEPCGWDLTSLQILPRGFRPSASPSPVEPIAGAPTAMPSEQAPPALRCANGHPCDPGDFLCSVCGAEVVGPAPEVPIPEAEEPSAIDGWRLGRRLASSSSVRQRFIATHAENQRRAVLTLYAPGSEPDPSVYDVLRSLPRDHVPDIVATGRWNDQAYEVSEELTGGTLADLGVIGRDPEVLTRIVSEIGLALNSFAEVGLRHRDLRPNAILVRSREPLDLVVTNFGSARLSDFDLDIVSPLETTRYTAPEAILGGVAAASDWWSLGMILLEQITGGECFEGVNEQAFLIHALTNGAPIPQDIDPRLHLLLCGLLARDRRERWSWNEVTRWLAGETLPAPASAFGAAQATSAGPTIQLAGRAYSSPTAFALAAASPAAWDDAKVLLLRGAMATWADEAGLDPKVRAATRQVAQLHELSDDFQLALALKTLNPAMPLTWRGEIVTPGWLLEHPEEGYALVTGSGPDLLNRMGSEVWLSQLKIRAAAVRDRANHLEVKLNEEELRIHLLSTSRSRLAALWEERRHILPDTDHPALLAILERRQTSEEDLILLLSADYSQFRTAEVIVDEAAREAAAAGLAGFDADEADKNLRQSHREIYVAVEKRSANFARCGIERIDQWVDQFRLERRLPISRALVVLSVSEDRWRTPARQAYVSTLLDFFARRVVVAVQRGPLTRMTIGKTTPRADLSELATERVTGDAMLNHLLLRSDQTFNVDPAAFSRATSVEQRIRSLHSHANLYRRDTGIDGLYLGFPFLLTRDGRGTRARITPVLLWPVRVRPEVGSRGRVSIGFDRDREEVRVNPAFDSVLGPEATKRWREVADELLGRASLTAGAVMDGFGTLATPQGRVLVPLPRDARVRAGDDQLICSAVLFHLAYTGQAVAEDLRSLKAIPPGGTALETALRVAEMPRSETPAATGELERFFTAASDPSQDAAVFAARRSPGLVVEGPPGTGKSQTIVNMVADAIGRKKSLLVVCQKQAALDVVHKRVVAEGLEARIGMITDVKPDRERIVRSVREQLEQIWAEPGGGDVSRRRQREVAAARIEALEQELDRYHSLLHRVDEVTGVSYRVLLGELIRLESGDPPAIDAPALRPLLRTLAIADVVRIEETSGPLAQYWLPAKYEDSPLADLEVFDPDPGSVAEFRGLFDEFSRREIERASVLERTVGALQVAHSAPFALWLRNHAEAFRGLTGSERDRLGRWLPLLPVEGDDSWAERLVAELTRVEAGLRHTRGPENATETDRVLIGLGDEAIRQWLALAEYLAAPAGLLAMLSPKRWVRKWRISRLFQDHGLADVPDDLDVVIAAADREIARRPWRQRLLAVWKQLDPMAVALDQWTEAQLTQLVHSLLEQLGSARILANRLRVCPQRNQILPVVRIATREAFDEFADRAEQGLTRAAARAASQAALDPLEGWLVARWRLARAQAIAADHRGESALAPIVQALPTLVPYQRFRLRAGQLSETQLAVFRTLRRIGSALEVVEPRFLDSVVRSTIGREARLAWKARIESENPTLLLESEEIESRIRSLASAEAEMRLANRELLTSSIDRNRLRSRQEWDDITRLTGPRARRLREFMDRGADLGLMELRPVWLMNPDVASRVLPLKSGLFDTVIYDEASQVPVEYALPSAFRSKSMIVSGDEKQMPPTAFFTSRVENDEADLFEPDEFEEGLTEQAREEASDTWNRREIKDCPDLLQLAKSVLPAATLQIHYRSAYRELISFSNASFYGNQLSVPVRHPDAEVRRARPVEIIRADGVYEDQTNLREAEKVVDYLGSLWSDSTGGRKTVGVVTFNRKQADLIEAVLEVRAENEARFRDALAQERERTEQGEDMSFFVKNVENVQGDERDIIIFSSTFGRNSQGTFRRSFGVLGQMGGERRLNVAVTRAKEKVVLVTSMPIAEISDLLATQRPPVSPRDYLQAYFEYARALSAGELEGGRAVLSRVASSRTQQDRGSGAESTELDGFQMAVAEFIRQLGWQPTPVSDTGAFGLDFAIEDPRTGHYGIGIECDAPRHRLLQSARARELWRPSVLKRSIPHVHRVSSRGWYHDRSAEQQRLRDAIEVALG